VRQCQLRTGAGLANLAVQPLPPRGLLLKGLPNDGVEGRAQAGVSQGGVQESGRGRHATNSARPPAPKQLEAGSDIQPAFSAIHDQQDACRTKLAGAGGAGGNAWRCGRPIPGDSARYGYLGLPDARTLV